MKNQQQKNHQPATFVIEKKSSGAFRHLQKNRPNKNVQKWLTRQKWFIHAQLPSKGPIHLLSLNKYINQSDKKNYNLPYMKQDLKKHLLQHELEPIRA